jgi:hypothetical protein
MNYQMLGSPEPVFPIAGKLFNRLSPFTDVPNEGDEMVDAVDDRRQNRSPQNNPDSSVELHRRRSSCGLFNMSVSQTVRSKRRHQTQFRSNSMQFTCMQRTPVPIRARGVDRNTHAERELLGRSPSDNHRNRLLGPIIMQIIMQPIQTKGLHASRLCEVGNQNQIERFANTVIT